MKAEIRRAQVTGAQAAVLVVVLVGFVVGRAALRRLVTRSHTTRSQIRVRLDEFMDG